MAADIYKFIVIIAGLTILFTLAGLPTGAGLLLDKAGVDLFSNPQDISLGTLVSAIFLAITAAAITGIFISFLTRTSPMFALLASYATLLLSFVGDLVAISTFNFANYEPWVGWITLLILVPLSLGYAHSLISWWAGRN